MLRRLSWHTLCQLYLFLLLLVACLFSALPYLVLPFALLVAMFWSTRRTAPLGLKVASYLTTVLLVPVYIDMILSGGLSMAVMGAVSVLPAFYLLDAALRENAARISPARVTGRWLVTATGKSLLAVSVLVVIIALVVAKPVLLLSGALLAVYLAAAFAGVLFNRRSPGFRKIVEKRIVAGNKATLVAEIESKGSAGWLVNLNPEDDWVSCTPDRFVLCGAATRLDIRVSPPLSGPSRPVLRSSLTDPRGLMQFNLSLQPADIHVIPRARYAEWLANRFLEHAGEGAGYASFSEPEVLVLRRGIEYYESRVYQPGDTLRNIDWKQTIKLRQMVVKDFVDSGQRPAIVLVNLSVASAEEADDLAYDLIATCLTLAQSHMPSSLTAYSHQEVKCHIPASDPERILRKALEMVKDIATFESRGRFLQPPDITRLRSRIASLKQMPSEPAQRLLGLLTFEYDSLQTGLRDHPAMDALLKATAAQSGPALILVVSRLNHDAQALAVMLEKLRREYPSISIGTGRRQRTFPPGQATSRAVPTRPDS